LTAELTPGGVTNLAAYAHIILIKLNISKSIKSINFKNKPSLFHINFKHIFQRLLYSFLLCSNRESGFNLN